jgi:hypothetical protein
MKCYCSICRKTAGGGGYAINLMADAETLTIQGGDKLSMYNARAGGDVSPAKRHFCSSCGSALWLWDPRWPELVHPHASAIDTPLPAPPQTVHIMACSAASWSKPEVLEGDLVFDEYPEDSIEQWHIRHDLLEASGDDQSE